MGALAVGAFALPSAPKAIAAGGDHIDIRVACPKDHPKVVELVERAKAYVLAQASDMQAAWSWKTDPTAVSTFPSDVGKAFSEPQPHTPRSTTKGRWEPLGPVPNDFGYPDGYWHWVDWSNPPVDDTFDGIVRPEDPQYLLLVQADEYPHHGTYRAPADQTAYAAEAARGWVVEGVMFAKDDGDPGPAFFTHEIDGVTYECNPFHNHGDPIENPHFHVWPWHHVHPFAMNPPHTCKGGTGYSAESPYPFRGEDHPSTQAAETAYGLAGQDNGLKAWGCLYDTKETDDHMGFEDPGLPAE